jgi:hypothetical protein
MTKFNPFSTDGWEMRPFLPKQLVDVSGAIPKLIETWSLNLSPDNEDGVPKYAALSYCWGDSVDAKLQPKLTKESLDDFMVSFSISNLLPVQQDTVTVTRVTNLQYLWNDARCILQNDVDDWQEQSAELGSIYRMADFTIVSLMESNQSSFLNPVNHEISLPFQHPFDSSKSGYYVLRFEGTLSDVYESYFVPELKKDLPNNRWITRDWTFQGTKSFTKDVHIWTTGCTIDLLVSSAGSSFQPLWRSRAQ